MKKFLTSLLLTLAMCGQQMPALAQNVKISAMPDATSVMGTDIFPIVRGSTNYFAKGSYVNTYILAQNPALAALASYNTNGILTQTAANTFVGRSIVGTSGYITLTNGSGVAGNPTITIDPTYVGQTSITTLGTVTTATWHGSPIDLASYVTGTLPGANLPNPASTVLGGVKSLAASSHFFVTGLSTGGALTTAQPSTADITGLGTAAAENLSAIIVDNGAGALTIGASQVTNSMLAGSIAASKLIGSDIATVGTLTGGATGAGFTIGLGTSTISGVLPSVNGGAGTISGALKGNGSGTVSQAACADLSNGATGCSTATGTSGATIGLLNGNVTHSGTFLFTGTVPTLANGNAAIAASSTKGGIYTGQGSVDDLDFQNKSGSDVCLVPTGTTTLNCTSLQVGGNAVLTGNQSITLSGDTAGSGTTAITTTTNKVNGVAYPSAPSTNTVPVITGSNTITYETCPIAAGCTGQTTNTTAFDALAPTPAQGNVLYYNGTHWVVLAPGTSGNFLQTQGAGANVVWASAAGGGTVTTTGSPATGNLTKFSGATAVTNGDLSGDVTTAGTLAATVAKIAGTTVSGTTGTTNVVFSASPTITGTALIAAQTNSGMIKSTSAQTVASATSATLDDVNIAAATTTVTGTTAITTAKGFNKVGIYAPTFTDASAVAVTNASTLYVDAAPTVGGSLTITNPWAIDVGSGNVNFPGTGNHVGTLTGGATGAGFTVALGTSTITGVLPSANGGAGSVSGVMKANGSGTTSAATPGTDYVASGTATVFTAQQNFGAVALTDASTITWNLATQQSAKILLTSAIGATRALGAPSNMVDGGTYILRITQSSTGSNALTYNAVYKWPGGTAPVLSTANNAVDVLTFTSDGTNMLGVSQLKFQ